MSSKVNHFIRLSKGSCSKATVLLFTLVAYQNCSAPGAPSAASNEQINSTADSTQSKIIVTTPFKALYLKLGASAYIPYGLQTVDGHDRITKVTLYKGGVLLREIQPNSAFVEIRDFELSDVGEYSLLIEGDQFLDPTAKFQVRSKLFDIAEASQSPSNQEYSDPELWLVGDPAPREVESGQRLDLAFVNDVQFWRGTKYEIKWYHNSEVVSGLTYESSSFPDNPAGLTYALQQMLTYNRRLTTWDAGKWHAELLVDGQVRVKSPEIQVNVFIKPTSPTLEILSDYVMDGNTPVIRINESDAPNAKILFRALNISPTYLGVRECEDVHGTPVGKMTSTGHCPDAFTGNPTSGNYTLNISQAWTPDTPFDQFGQKRELRPFDIFATISNWAGVLKFKIEVICSAGKQKVDGFCEPQ